MDHYDVVIVGAGPAGLMCAETLAGSGKRVLVLEKNKVFGDKVCAGGLTRKDLALLDIPDRIIEHKVTRTAVFSGRKHSQTNAPEPFIFTVNRVELGTWQAEKVRRLGVKVMNEAKVTSISDHKVTVNGSLEFGYEYLVGADGYFSVVRKHLGLPVEKRLIGIQYLVPDPNLDPRLEIHLDAGKFHSWYGWKFPHNKSFVIGCVCDPDVVLPAKMKKRFHRWLDEKGVDLSGSKYYSFPISYDYRGHQFGKIFLAGEAAGLTSGLTGEGIYQALISGKAAGESVLGLNVSQKELEKAVRYNQIQNRILRVFIAAGPLRGLIHKLIITLLNNPRIKNKINSSFS